MSEQTRTCTYDRKPAVARVQWSQYGGAVKTVYVCDHHERVARGSRLHIDLLAGPIDNGDEETE